MKKATKLVQEECRRFGLEMIDIKFEFGKVDGKSSSSTKYPATTCACEKTESPSCKKNFATLSANSNPNLRIVILPLPIGHPSNIICRATL